MGAVVMVDPQRFVLIRRANPPGAGSWTLPGGRVQQGEALSAALIREVREETGLQVEVGALLEVVELMSDDYHFVVLDYAARRIGGELVAGDDASEARAVRIEELADYGVTDLVEQVVKKAFSTG